MTFDEQRRRMVAEQLQARGITDERVLAAFLKVPRHVFVPEASQAEAYADHPLPIEGDQTMSQPYIVALMTQLLRLQGHERVLEVGTGSGYQMAILAELALEVYSVERLAVLAEKARARLQQLGYVNVHVTTADGSLGRPESGPYDGILITAGAPEVPVPLVEQLAEGGRFVIPLGGAQAQMLTLFEKRAGHLMRQEITGCVFVPLRGRYGWASE